MNTERFSPGDFLREQEGDKFDVSEALNNKDFLEFLTKYGDAESFDSSEANTQEIEKRFQSFESKNASAAALKAFYKKEVIEKTIIGGEAKGWEKPVDEYIEKVAIENPELMTLIHETLYKKQEAEKEIESRTLEIKDILRLIAGKESLEIMKFSLKDALERSADQARDLLNLEKSKKEALVRQSEKAGRLVEIKRSMTGVRGLFNFKNFAVIGWIFRNPEEREAKRRPKQELEAIAKILEKSLKKSEEKKLPELESNVKILTEVLETEKLAGMAKAVLLDILPTGQMVKEKAAQHVSKFMESLISSKGKKELGEKPLEELLSIKKSLEDAVSEGEALKIMEQVDGEKTEKAMGQLEVAIENRVTKEIMDSVFSAKLKSRPLEEMEKIIKGYLDKPLNESAKKALELILKSPRVSPEKKILLKKILLEKF